MLTGPLHQLLTGQVIITPSMFRGSGVSSDRARLVLTHLAAHHNDATGACHPGVSLLGQQLGLSKSRVYDALAALEDAGLIVRLARMTSRGPNSAPNYVFPWHAARTIPDHHGPAPTGPSTVMHSGPATAGPSDGPARWSRQMVPLDGPAPQEMNGTERNGRTRAREATDPTHGGHHPPGNPTNKPCTVCREQRLIRSVAPPNPPTLAENLARSFCEACGQAEGARHLPSCAAAS